MLTNKVLLIDDDPEEIEIFSEALSNLDKNIDCVGAKNCNDGFAKLNASQGLPRYIFLDLNMPGSYGVICLDQLKKHPLYNSIPVFIYTSSNRESDKRQTIKLGAQLFITKPNTMEELKNILSYVITEEWKHN
jgi:CheY-like chemotaxis protein